jgi:nicotinate-nucleotide adenylyltransferase
MKTAILGGSLNPPHFGHLYLGFCALKSGFDRVLFMPSGKQSKKQFPDGISDEDRKNMVLLAIEGESRFGLCDWELQKEGITYSIDTVTELLNHKIVEGRPGFIIGDDLATDFPNWKEPLELSEVCTIVLARRDPGFRGDFGFEHIRLQNRLLPHSSSLIRELAASHQPFRFLVPDPVYKYIMDKGLYGCDRQDF